MLIKKVLPEIQRKWVIIFVITLLIIPQNFRLIGSTIIKLLHFLWYSESVMLIKMCINAYKKDVFGAYKKSISWNAEWVILFIIIIR